jgi:hypothetical protein
MPPAPQRRRRGAGLGRGRPSRTSRQLDTRVAGPFGAGHRGRSAARGWLPWVVADGGPPTAQGPLQGTQGSRPAGDWANLGENAGFEEKFAGLTKDRASAGAAGCWAPPVCRRAPARHGLSLRLRRFLVAVLRILGVRSTQSSPGSAGSAGACGTEIPLRRSCVADFLRGFSAPCPRVDGAPSAAEQASLPATKKQWGGKGTLAGHHEPPHPPSLLGKKEHHHERNTHP